MHPLDVLDERFLGGDNLPLVGFPQGVAGGVDVGALGHCPSRRPIVLSPAAVDGLDKALALGLLLVAFVASAVEPVGEVAKPLLNLAQENLVAVDPLSVFPHGSPDLLVVL